MSDQLSSGRFGEWLQQRRKEYGYTQSELAHLVCCSMVTIERIEQGVRRPSVQLAELIASALDVPPDQRSAIVRLARLSPRAATDTKSTETLHPNNLPRQLTSFIGREKQLVTLAALLSSDTVRLLVLSGAGGSGKTRLALQVASQALERFPDGVFFVDLAPLTDPDLVLPAIARALQVNEQPGQPFLDTLKNYLREKQALLLLDNFEQVVEAAPQLPELLAAAPQLKMLVTSREVLNVRGEHDFPVLPLCLPDIGHLPPLEELSRYEAIRLFVERATSYEPEFELNGKTIRAVPEICARLDGLPLAIELAAARVRVLPPVAMLDHLQNRLKLLTGGGRDLTARQQTLRGAIDWSYDLLGEREKQLFRRMAAFQGGRTLEALEVVCNYDGHLQLDVLDGVDALLSNSLVQQRGGCDGEPRFWMLETIHEYAREKLRESGEAEELSRAHAAYFLALAEEAVPHLMGEDPRAWYDRLEDEHDNLRSAVNWATERARLDRDGGRAQAGKNGDVGEAGETDETDETALRLVAALERFWRPKGYFSEGRSRMEAALAATSRSTFSSSSSPRGRRLAKARASALSSLSFICFPMKDYVAGRAAAEEALAISRELGDARSAGWTLFKLGATVKALGDHDGGKALLEESVAVFRQFGEDSQAGEALVNLAVASIEMGDLDEAKRLLEEALQLCRQAKDKMGIALIDLNLGWVALRKDYASARSHMEAALSAYRQMGSRYRQFSCLDSLVDVELISGNHAAARSVLAEALALGEEMGLDKSVADLHFKEGLLALEQGDAVQAGPVIHGAFQRLVGEHGSELDDAQIAYWLRGFARVASATGDRVRAARLLGASGRLQKAWGIPLPPLSRIVYERALQAVRSQLSEEEFQRAWQEGTAMSTEEAIEYALAPEPESAE